jgi:dCMP deaminase
MKTDWDKRFLGLADYISKWSKDKSRGVGAVIVNDDKRVVSFGYNGFPSGVDDEIEARHERPAKYDWTVHAEENAITNAARIGVATKDTTMYLNLFPCARCAGNIINSGIKKVVVSKEPNFEDEKYGNEFRISKEKLTEAKVEILIKPEKRIFKIDIGSVAEEDVDEYIKKVKEVIFKHENDGS